MMQDKDCQNFLKEIADQCDYFYINSELTGHKFVEANDLAKTIENLKINCQILPNFSAIFSDINQRFSQTNNLVLITGSLYQASEFLLENNC